MFLGIRNWKILLLFHMKFTCGKLNWKVNVLVNGDTITKSLFEPLKLQLNPNIVGWPGALEDLFPPSSLPKTGCIRWNICPSGMARPTFPRLAITCPTDTWEKTLKWRYLGNPLVTILTIWTWFDMGRILAWEHTLLREAIYENVLCYISDPWPTICMPCRIKPTCLNDESYK